MNFYCSKFSYLQLLLSAIRWVSIVFRERNAVPCQLQAGVTNDEFSSQRQANKYGAVHGHLLLQTGS